MESKIDTTVQNNQDDPDGQTQGGTGSRKYEELPDEELILRMRSGEPGISDYLMEKYKWLVRQKVREMFLAGGEQDDLIQEGMIGLFKAVRDYRPEKETSFQTFARLCIDRQLYTAIKTQNRQKHLPLNSYISLSTEGEEIRLWDARSEDPEKILLEQESAGLLRNKIWASLSRMETQVLESYLKGAGYSAIAEKIGKTPKSVDNALRRIRAKIKAEITQSEGYSE